MSIETKVSAAIKESGMTYRAISQKTSISYARLYAVMNGRGELRASEYLALCKLLRLDPRNAEGVTI